MLYVWLVERIKIDIREYSSAEDKEGKLELQVRLAKTLAAESSQRHSISASPASSLHIATFHADSTSSSRPLKSYVVIRPSPENLVALLAFTSSAHEDINRQRAPATPHF